MKDIKNCFILVENQLYINVKQDVLKLYLELFTKTKPFQFFERKTRNRIVNFFPISTIRAIRVLHFTFKFHKKKKKFRKSRDAIPTIESKYCGSLLLLARTGEKKIFNLKHSSVITSFPEQKTYKEIEKVIRTIRKSTSCELAPNVINWNIDERYLLEEYINIRRPSYNFDNLKAIYFEVFPVLESIAFTSTPKMININKYVEEKLNDIESVFKMNTELSSNYSQIRSFLNHTKLMIENDKRDNEIALVTSHGDLWIGNLLINKKHARVIDWNTLDQRNFYFDYYYFFFMLASNKISFDRVDKEEIKKLSLVLNRSFYIYNEKMNMVEKFRAIDIKANLRDSELYRYLFYIELIALKIDEINSSEVQSTSEIMTWISRFELFEKVVINDSKSVNVETVI